MRVLSRRSSGELDDVGWVAGCCLLGVARWVMFVGLLGVAVGCCPLGWRKDLLLGDVLFGGGGCDSPVGYGGLV